MPVTMQTDAIGQYFTRYLDNATNQVTDLTQKLSSGKRITKAADDPVDMVVASRINSEISGINQSLKNSSSMLDTIAVADQGLKGISDTLRQMSDLSRRSATEKLTEAERSAIDQEFRTLKQSLTKLVNDTEYNGTKLLRDMQFYGVDQKGSVMPGPGGVFDKQLGPNYQIGLGPTYYLGKLANDPTSQINGSPSYGKEIADRTILNITNTLALLQRAGLINSQTMSGVQGNPSDSRKGGLVLDAQIANSSENASIYSPTEARRVYYLLEGIKTPQGRTQNVGIRGVGEAPGLTGPGLIEQVLTNRAELGSIDRAVRMTQDNLKNMLAVNQQALERTENLDVAQAKNQLNTSSILAQSAAAMLPYSSFTPNLALSIISGSGRSA
jgi:flagellin